LEVQEVVLNDLYSKLNQQDCKIIDEIGEQTGKSLIIKTSGFRQHNIIIRFQNID
jgi:nucleoside-triphosphatase THEP1